MFGDIGGGLMALLTVLAATSTINASFAAVPRMFYGLARQGLLPKAFKYIHPKFRTPSISIIFVFLMFALPLFVLDVNITLITTLLMAASVTWLITYIIAQINVLILRKRYPDIERPFKAPFAPYIQIIGISVCIYMIVTVHPDPSMKWTVYTISGSLLLCISIYAFTWLKYKKLPLFTPMTFEELKAQKEGTMTNNVIEELTPLISSEKSW